MATLALHLTAEAEIRDAAETLRRTIAGIGQRTTAALEAMDRGQLPAYSGMNNAGYLGHQIPSDLTVATVRLERAINLAHVLGVEADRINAAYAAGVIEGGGL
jgi:hypothetical protein